MGRFTPERFAFSGPVYYTPLYPEPPMHYRHSEGFSVVYETDEEPVLDLLPPEVEPADSPPVVLLRISRHAFSTFGPHHGLSTFVRVRLDGQIYNYVTYIWVDSEAAFAAGREVWGDAKKLANIDLRWDREEVIGTVERPVGKRLLTMTMAIQRRMRPEELPAGVPGATLKVIPSPRQGAPPAIAELNQIEFAITPEAGSDGQLEVYTGPASLSFDSPSQTTPIHRLAPRRILGGFYGSFLIDLGHGETLRRHE